ncbi:MAG: DarT ssDNA thymidine ADP-ribosyltransferase family protein [Ferruginibacter sp.]
MTSFYDKTCVDDLPEIIDWAAIKAAYWSGQENLNLKRKKQAEFLASEDIPPNLIFGFGCYNNAAKNKLIELGIQEEKIKVIPGSYY